MIEDKRQVTSYIMSYISTYTYLSKAMIGFLFQINIGLEYATSKLTINFTEYK